MLIISESTAESGKLADIRDTLLTKLTSGELIAGEASSRRRQSHE
jgi:hypothetical protein